MGAEQSNDSETLIAEVSRALPLVTTVFLPLSAPLSPTLALDFHLLT